MNSRAIDLALRKQRLQLKSSALREQWRVHAAGLQPVMALGDRVGEGFVWLRRHPAAVLAGTATLVLLRPRGVFRWARRGFAGWQLWRQARRWLAAPHGRPFSQGS